MTFLQKHTCATDHISQIHFPDTQNQKPTFGLLFSCCAFFFLQEEDLLHVAAFPQTSTDLSFFSIGIRKHSPRQILLFLPLFFALYLHLALTFLQKQTKNVCKNLRDCGNACVNVPQSQMLLKCQKKVMCGELHGQLSVLADYLF